MKEQDPNNSRLSDESLPGGEHEIIKEELLLAYGGVYLPVPKGYIIFKEGTHCRFYHQLVTGSVRWVSINEDGREYIQSIIGPGECFGELPLFDNEPYAATAVADTDSVLIRLHKDSFLQLIHEEPQAHFSITRQLAKRVRQRFFFLRSFTNPSTEGRIRELFEWMRKEKKFLHHADGHVILTRQQIADLTGLRVETVIRTIRSMAKEGTLVLKSHKIFLQYR